MLTLAMSLLASLPCPLVPQETLASSGYILSPEVFESQPAPSGGCPVNSTCKASKFSLLAGHQLCLNSTTCSSTIKANSSTLAPTIISGAVNGASAVGIILDTSTSYSTAGSKLLSIRNGGTEKLAVDKDGKILGTFATPQLIDMSYAANGIKLSTGSVGGGDVVITDTNGTLFAHVASALITVGAAENPVPIVHAAQIATAVAMEFGRSAASGGGVLAISFATAFASAPSCVCTDENAVPVVCGISTAPTGSGVTFSITIARADNLDWHCTGPK